MFLQICDKDIETTFGEISLNFSKFLTIRLLFERSKVSFIFNHRNYIVRLYVLWQKFKNTVEKDTLLYLFYTNIYISSWTKSRTKLQMLNSKSRKEKNFEDTIRMTCINDILGKYLSTLVRWIIESVAEQLECPPKESAFNQCKCCPSLVKLGNNETNNSCTEASHVLCNTVARVQMARF